MRRRQPLVVLGPAVRADQLRHQEPVLDLGASGVDTVTEVGGTRGAPVATLHIQLLTLRVTTDTRTIELEWCALDLIFLWLW